MPAIDNLSLLAESTVSSSASIVIKASGESRRQLKRGIKVEHHFVYVNEFAWAFVQALHGGGPAIRNDPTALDTSELPSTQPIKVSSSQKDENQYKQPEPSDRSPLPQ
jgi:hypothetical protein